MTNTTTGTENSKVTVERGLKALAKHRSNKPVLLLNMSHVAPSAAMLVAHELRGKKFPELDVVLQTPGGHIETAYKIVKLLRAHAEKINIIVPTHAKSAGTLICLAAETLVMGVGSELGPLDVQIPEHQDGDVDTYKSALNGYKALEQIQTHAIGNMDTATQLILKRTGSRMRLQEVIKLAIEFSGNTSSALYSQLHPKQIAENARSLDIGEQYGVRILTRYMNWPNEKASDIVQRLVYNYPSHEFIIDKEELLELGFQVESPSPDEEPFLDALGVILSMSETDEIKLYEFTPPPLTQAENRTDDKQKAQAVHHNEQVEKAKQ